MDKKFGLMWILDKLYFMGKRKGETEGKKGKREALNERLDKFGMGIKNWIKSLG